MATSAQDSEPPDAPARRRVLITEADPGARVLLRQWLERHGSFDVVAETADGVQAVEGALRVRPEVAVLGLGMPRMDGLEAAAEIRRLLPDTRIVIRSAFSAERMAQKAIDAGADVYIEKAAESSQLLAVLEGLFPARGTGSDGAPDGVSLDALDVPRLLDAVSTPLAVLRWREDEPSAPADFVVAHANPAAQALTGWVVGSQVDREAVEALDGHLQPIGDDDVVVSWQLAAVPGSSEGTTRPVEDSAGPSDTTELLEAAVITSPVGAVLLDGSARLVIANPVADRLLGGSPLLGSDQPSRILRWADTLEPVRDEDLPLQAACEGAPFDDVELLVTQGDGSEGGGTYVKLSGRPVLGPQGSPAGAVISVLDDTANKEAERALAATHEELQRSNTELGNFASTASHDLSQPLQKIYGFAELLQEHSLEDAQAHDYIDKIVAGCERMSTLIRDLLTYSRLTSEARPFERVDLAPVVRDVVDLFEQQIADRGARIEVDPLPAVLADRTQMSQLFQNLIGNALTYVTSGVPPVIEVHSARGPSEWQITVADNGIGISPENRQRAFAMFERLATSEEHAGTGIGLAVCAKVAERHGGRIWIDETPGGGTSISFTLPDRPPS